MTAPGVGRREFGRSDLRLSALSFGPMRLNPARVTAEGALELIEHLHAGGVTTLHSSHEYETHAFFCDVLRRFRARHAGAELVHICKLAAPHFGEPRFLAERMREQIERALRELGAERIDVVQWLVRSKPLADTERLRLLDESSEALTRAWEDLRREGKVSVLASFPYSVPFADAVLRQPLCAGLVSYLNLDELELASRLDAMERAGHGLVAIRPLHAGSFGPAVRPALDALGVRERDRTAFALQFPLLHPAVSSVLLGVSSVEHADEALAAVASARIDRARFYEVVAAVELATSRMLEKRA